MTRAALVLLAVLAVGCGKSGSPNAAPTTPPATTASSPATSPTESPAPSATRAATPSRTPSPTATGTDLKDGDTYVYAKSIDTTKGTVVVDVVQFLTGDAAQKAAAEDGQEVDNDYYVRNQSTRLRTLPFQASMPIVVNTLTADETGDATKDTTITLPKFAAYFDSGDAQQRLFILTISKGVVVKVHEQYLP